MAMGFDSLLLVPNVECSQNRVLGVFKILNARA